MNASKCQGSQHCSWVNCFGFEMCKNYTCSIWMKCNFLNYSIILFRQKSTECVFGSQWCFALLWQINGNLQLPCDQNRGYLKKCSCRKNETVNFNLNLICLLAQPNESSCLILQCWISNTQWLSPVVIFAFQKKLHALTVSQGNPDSWPGSESDSGSDCHWKDRGAFHTGKEDLIGFYHCSSKQLYQNLSIIFPINWLP